MMTEFENAQENAKKYPATFQAPSEEDLSKIGKDDTVKVCVQGERFWVTVTKVEGDRVTGIVDNDLVGTVFHGLRLGSHISFKKENIYSIFEG